MEYSAYMYKKVNSNIFYVKKRECVTSFLQKNLSLKSFLLVVSSFFICSKTHWNIQDIYCLIGVRDIGQACLSRDIDTDEKCFTGLTTSASDTGRVLDVSLVPMTSLRIPNRIWRAILVVKTSPLLSLVRHTSSVFTGKAYFVSVQW